MLYAVWCAKWPCSNEHDDVINWKHFPRYWPFVRGINLSPVSSPHKGQWRGALMFPLICSWINVWASNREGGDLKRHRAHYDITVMHPAIVAASQTNNRGNMACFRLLFFTSCCWRTDNMLTHWDRDKMAAIFQTKFSSGFSWMKMYEFRLTFHWSLFLAVQFTIFQHWFR